MDNQHQKITGYRELDQQDINLMNAIKAKEQDVAALLQHVQSYLGGGQGRAGEALRQAAIARTEFEHAFMRLVRAVAQPVSPWVP